MMTTLSPSLPSLLNLCGIHVSYLMWTRLDKTKWPSKCVFVHELIESVLANVQRLPIPEEVKSLMRKHVPPAGRHLFSLFTLWLSKTHFEFPQRCLTDDMFFECIIPNADGLINQRKTAEKMLSTTMLPDVFCFRLACINFLEKEVLKLWPVVKKYLLNKIILDSEQPLAFNISFTNRRSYHSFNRIFELSEIEISRICQQLPHFPCTTEPSEVLFWIGYCVSKENNIDMKELPHFARNDVDWYEFCLEDATFSGNVACFDYFKNFDNGKIEYNNVKMIEKNFAHEQILPSRKEDYKQLTFIYHFMLLNSQEKFELFQKFPKETVSHFLKWPLSLTFLENIEEIWNLIPDGHKDWVFFIIFAILFHDNTMLLTVRFTNSDLSEYHYLGPVGISGTHSVEHLESIWVALWKISLDSYKSLFLNSFVFFCIEHSSQRQEFRTNFETSGLKETLHSLFLSNEEVVLELCKGVNMKESLRSLVARRIPEDFEDLDRRCISFLETNQEGTFVSNMRGLLKQRYRDVTRSRCNAVNEKFVNYVKNLFP